MLSAIRRVSSAAPMSPATSNPDAPSPSAPSSATSSSTGVVPLASEGLPVRLLLGVRAAISALTFYAKAAPEETPEGPPPQMTELILLRHGETVGQSSIRLYGATDIALSPLGEQQAARAAAALQARRLARVVTSPLQRARRSAEIVLAAQPAPAATLEVLDDLREVD